VAHILLPGRDGAFIRTELDEGFRRDLERSIPVGRARRRYRSNLLKSAWSLHWGHLRSFVSSGLLTDARLGMRLLARQPLLTAVAMLALGLGIPASLSIFHMVDVMYSPLPVPEGERVMGIREWDAAPHDPVPTSIHDYERWREELQSFEAVGAVRSYSMNVHAGDPSVPPVMGAEITASGLDLLRVRPLLGRLLGPEDQIPGAPDVVLLREDLWRARFGGDPEIVGRSIRIGGDSYTVVGVLPADFRFALDDQVWMPLRARAVDYPVGGGPRLKVFGRLAPGVDRETAGTEMLNLTARRRADDPDRLRTITGEVVTVPGLLMEQGEFFEGNPDWALMKLVVFSLLFLVCGNVGVLVLARTSSRAKEITIRTALGASRGRIVVQVFVETLVLGLAATGLGLLAAEFVARELAALIGPFGLQYWMDLGLTPGIILSALGLAVCASAVAGVLPAIRATGGQVRANLQRVAAGGSSVRFGLGSSLLIVTEVVLAIGFLAVGGILVQSGFRNTSGDWGFDRDDYAVGTVRLPLAEAGLARSDSAPARSTVAQLREGVLEELREEPGVVGVGLGSSLPGGTGGGWPVIVEGEPEEEPVRTARQWVHVGFFEGLGRPILAGRDFDGSDVEVESGRYPDRVIVSTSFVDQVLGGRQPIGRRFRYRTPTDTTGADATWYQIVGVVGPFGVNVVNPRRDAAVYHPLSAADVRPARYLVEVSGDSRAFAPRFRELVAGVDPEATVTDAVPLGTIIESELTFFRLVAALTVALAGIAFLLSVSGLYALMSFTVSQRTREIGIRAALGASALDIMSTIAGRAAAQLAIGLALGAVWAWVLLADVLGVDTLAVPVDIPLTIAGTLVCAALVGVVACLSPTLRGLRIEPTEALRES